MARVSWLSLCWLLVGFLTSAPVAAQDRPATVRVVGGLEGLTQYQRHELPFWRDRVPALTGGRLRAEIVPFDRSGIRAQDMINLIRLGALPFGYVLAQPAAVGRRQGRIRCRPCAFSRRLGSRDTR